MRPAIEQIRADLCLMYSLKVCGQSIHFIPRIKMVSFRSSLQAISPAALGAATLVFATIVTIGAKLPRLNAIKAKGRP